MSNLIAPAVVCLFLLSCLLFVRRSRRKSAEDDAPTDAFTYAASGSIRVKFRCGDVGPGAIVYDLFGTKIKASFSENSPFCPDCCLKQLREQVIRCALCGHPILPGEVVHLARVQEAKPEWTTRYGGEQVLCNSSDCAAPNLAGTWTGKTVKEFFGSDESA